MKHPTREEWMSFLYDETPVEERAGLRSHLEACADCRTQLKVWQGATRELDRWRLPSRRKTLRQTTFVHWAAAAAVIGLALVGAARLASLSREVKQLRADAPRISQVEFQAALAQASEQATKAANAEAQALVAAVTERLEERRLADQQAVLAALQKLNARHTEDFASLRKELETVAVFTEAGLQRTQNELANIGYSPRNISDNTPH
jgi:hypothetical protein